MGLERRIRRNRAKERRKMIESEMLAAIEREVDARVVIKEAIKSVNPELGVYEYTNGTFNYVPSEETYLFLVRDIRNGRAHVTVSCSVPRVSLMQALNNGEVIDFLTYVIEQSIREHIPEKERA